MMMDVIRYLVFWYGYFLVIFGVALLSDKGITYLKRRYVLCSCPLPPDFPWQECLGPCRWCDYIHKWAFEKEDLGHPYRGKYE